MASSTAKKLGKRRNRRREHRNPVSAPMKGSMSRIGHGHTGGRRYVGTAMPLCETASMGANDRRERQIMQALLANGEINRDEIIQEFATQWQLAGKQPRENLAKRVLEALKKEGYISISGDMVGATIKAITEFCYGNRGWV